MTRDFIKHNGGNFEIFSKMYRNKAGKSFTEGKGFRMPEFMDYYNTLTDDEWADVIKMTAEKGVDVSNIKPYIRVRCNDIVRPMSFEEVREKLLKFHNFNAPMFCTCAGVVPIEEERRNIEDLYAALGVSVPEYWSVRLWT